MKVLIIDDEKQLVSALTAIFNKNQITTDCAYDGEEGLEYVLTQLYDVIVLDVMLPKLNGFEVLKKMRQKGISTPVLLLSAKSETADKIEGLETGADDYLTKPFDSRELIARIKALTRRKGAFFGNDLSFGDLVLNTDTHKLSCGNKDISLGSKEYQIMEMLLRNTERIISKDLIIEKVWGFDSEVEYNNVEVYLSFLRRKLTSLSSKVVIRPIRSVGYKLELEND
ncbi:MAG: response regulator transcription factor [Clostridia bacterium]|nr:response regulator transcription factor [Clostridia bacterium]